MPAFYPELSSRCPLAQHTITGSGGGPSKSPRSFHKCLSCRPPPPWSFPAVPDAPLDLRKVALKIVNQLEHQGIQAFNPSSRQASRLQVPKVPWVPNWPSSRQSASVPRHPLYVYLCAWIFSSTLTHIQ
jgi:hypothetical protein